MAADAVRYSGPADASSPARCRTPPRTSTRRAPPRHGARLPRPWTVAPDSAAAPDGDVP
ncbi:hypothetical protein NKH77_19750 [Streptomyces sp. M19]